MSFKFLRIAGHLCFHSLIYAACSQAPREVSTSLTDAGNNRLQLEKVIEHYKRQGDDEKLKAAYFLIANMKGRYNFEGPGVAKYDYIFNLFDSLHRSGVKFSNNSPLIHRKWDSLVATHGRPYLDEDEAVHDLNHIKAAYLIENIDEAFKVWKERPWGESVSFESFCELILPYRIFREPLEAWRKPFQKDYQPVFDTLKSKSAYSFAEAINNHLKSVLATNHAMAGYSFGIPPSKMRKGRRGTCYQLVSYTTMAMRANGLPVAIDRVGLWGNRGGNHSWNTLLLENGKYHPFNAAHGSFTNPTMFIYKFAKAWRETFAAHAFEVPSNTDEVPGNLIDINRIDVTHEYTKTFDLRIPLEHVDENKKYAVICTFDNRAWRPQDWGHVKNGKAYFNNMGAEVLYRVMYYDDGSFEPASQPFVLTKDGRLRGVASQEGARKQNMHLLRKYPMFATQVSYLQKVIGGRIQGANKPDFSDSVNLYTIKTMAEKLEAVNITDIRKFRFLRYIAADNKPASISELEIYGEGGKKLQGKIIGAPITGTEFPLKNAFDGKLETFFHGGGKSKKWVGLEFSKPMRLSRIRYCPQNDTNFIIEGNAYELFYWGSKEWVSLGTMTAKEQAIDFKNVPVGKLYLLKNLAGGREVRPFTYENGKQVWW